MQSEGYWIYRNIEIDDQRVSPELDIRKSEFPRIEILNVPLASCSGNSYQVKKPLPGNVTVCMLRSDELMARS